MPSALIIVVLAQLLGTSSWFSGNAAAADLAIRWGLSDSQRGLLLTAVQLGFIVGTFGISLTGLADAFPANRLFAAAALLAVITNASFALVSQGIVSATIFRFLTGLALAGVYPVGMKLAVGWAPHGIGAALGWLVGALVLGTASPHLVRAVGHSWSWQTIVLTSSALTLVAGMMVLLLGEGPAKPAPARLQWGGVFGVFRIPRVRASALGYFGHMWELYAFWFLVPRLVGDDPLEAFGVIAAGAIGCVVGGLLSRRVGSHRVAAVALVVSGLCCVMFPFIGPTLVAWKLVVLMCWGIAVVADSPQFSALSAGACPRETVGAALAVQNAIGFAITVAAIQLVSAQWPLLGPRTVWLLAPGPLFGLLAMRPLFARDRR